MEGVDEDFHRNLTWTLYAATKVRTTPSWVRCWRAYRENDIEGIVELTFSVDDEKFGERHTIDLIPNGRNLPVTNENKHKYVE
jgi:E3 ubiquitin-protein ligase NEDD4